jgi:hypothetical protein
MGHRSPLQANHPKRPVLLGETILISSLPNVLNVLPVSHIHTSFHAGRGCVGWTRLPCAVQCVCKRHTYTILPRPADIILGHSSRSHVPQSNALVGYLETYLGRTKHWLRDWRSAINVSKSTAVLLVETARRIQKPRPVQFLGEPIQLVKTAR